MILVSKSDIRQDTFLVNNAIENKMSSAIIKCTASTEYCKMLLDFIMLHMEEWGNGKKLDRNGKFLRVGSEVKFNCERWGEGKGIVVASEKDNSTILIGSVFNGRKDVAGLCADELERIKY